MDRPDEEENRSRIRAGQHQLQMTARDVWLRYVAISGEKDFEDIVRYLDGSGSLPEIDVKKLAAALNEEFTEQGSDHPIRPTTDT